MSKKLYCNAPGLNMPDMINALKIAGVVSGPARYTETTIGDPAITIGIGLNEHDHTNIMRISIPDKYGDDAVGLIEDAVFEKFNASCINEEDLKDAQAVINNINTLREMSLYGIDGKPKGPINYYPRAKKTEG